MSRRCSLTAVVLVLMMVQGCVSVRDILVDPEVEFVDMTLNPVNLFESRPVFRFRVTNPNPIGVMIGNVSYNLKINEKKFIKGVTDRAVRIDANGENMVTMPFSVNHLDFFNGISDIASSGKVAWDLSGKFRVDVLDIGFDIPYHVDGTFDLPPFPDISLESVRLDGITAKGVSMTLSLGIANRNPFPVNLSGMHYRVRLGNTEILSETANTVPAIGKKGISKLKIPVRFGFKEIGGVVTKLFGKKSTSYALDGNFVFKIPVAGETRIPFRKTGIVGFEK